MYTANLIQCLGSAFGSAVREFWGIPPPSAVFTGQYGVPEHSHPGQSLRYYSENVDLYRSVQLIAMEIARIPLRLQTVSANDEIKVV